MSGKLNFSYDTERDVLTIEGQQYSGELFRAWAEGGLPTDQLFRFIRKEDGSFMIGKVFLPEENAK
jgi:hypothetical protein